MGESPYCPRHQRYIRNGGCVDCTREVEEAKEEGRREVRSELSNVSAQGKVLLTDVDDMMGALRCIASTGYTLEESRSIAHAALERLKVRGIGETVPHPRDHAREKE